VSAFNQNWINIPGKGDQPLRWAEIAEKKPGFKDKSWV
jgi:hypothetical protein